MNKLQWLGLVFVIFIASCGFGLIGVYVYEESKGITPSNQTSTKTIYILTVHRTGWTPEVFESENRLYATWRGDILTIYEVDHGMSIAIAEYLKPYSWKVETHERIIG